MVRRRWRGAHGDTSADGHARSASAAQAQRAQLVKQRVGRAGPSLATSRRPGRCARASRRIREGSTSSSPSPSRRFLGPKEQTCWTEPEWRRTLPEKLLGAASTVPRPSPTHWSGLKDGMDFAGMYRGGSGWQSPAVLFSRKSAVIARGLHLAEMSPPPQPGLPHPLGLRRPRMGSRPPRPIRIRRAGKRGPSACWRTTSSRG